MSNQTNRVYGIFDQSEKKIGEADLSAKQFNDYLCHSQMMAGLIRVEIIPPDWKVAWYQPVRAIGPDPCAVVRIGEGPHQSGIKLEPIAAIRECLAHVGSALSDLNRDHWSPVETRRSLQDALRISREVISILEQR